VCDDAAQCTPIVAAGRRQTCVRGVKTARKRGWVTAKDVKVLNNQLQASGYL